MSSRNKRDRERERRSVGDSKNDGSKEENLSNGISTGSPPRNASAKETSTSVGGSGKDDFDDKSNETIRDEVVDFIRNSTDPKMTPLRAEYEALLHGDDTARPRH